jgi:hypothetical protein
MKRFLLFLLLAGTAFGQQRPPSALGNWPLTGTPSSSTYLRGDGFWGTPAGGGTPGGSTTQVQYNNAGAFAGSSGFVFDGTGKITLTIANLIVTPTPAVELVNTTAATAPTPSQNSPVLRFQGQGWKLAPSAASQAIEWRMYALPSATADVPVENYFNIDAQTNGAGWVNQASLWDGNGTGGPYGSTLFVTNFSGSTFATKAGAGVGYLNYAPQTAKPPTPATNAVRIYSADSTGTPGGTAGHLLAVDSGGTVHDLFATGGGAPTTATYITQTANGSLTNSQALSALATGILKSTTATGVLSIAVAGDFPTLNQNSTGSAASLSVSGQTGLMTVTGLTSVNRVKTVRDAADTILELGGSYTPTGTWTNLTMVTPVLGTPTSGTLTNCTFPTLNQSTTGSAATLTTSRNLWGQGFNGSADVTGNLTSVGNITGGASSMTIQAGTGNSRTLALQSTTSGGTATTFLTGNADQSSTFGGNISGTGAWTVTGGAGNMTIVSGTGNSRTMTLQTTTSGGTATTAATISATQVVDFANAPTAATVAIPTISSTSTLTNKRINPRVDSSTATNATTWAPNSDTTDIFELAGALTVAVTTISNPSGTPVEGQKLMVRVKSDSSAHALTWSGTQWRASGATGAPALPTTTTASKNLYALFVYNSTDTKWDLLAVQDGY